MNFQKKMDAWIIPGILEATEMFLQGDLSR